MSRAGETRPTGWIRYRICDRSGCGWNRDHWYFMPGIEQLSANERREQIVQECETWAIHAESYSFSQWIGEVPPPEILTERIAGMRRSRDYLADQIKILDRQLAAQTELTTL